MGICSRHPGSQQKVTVIHDDFQMGKKWGTWEPGAWVDEILKMGVDYTNFIEGFCVTSCKKRHKNIWVDLTWRFVGHTGPPTWGWLGHTGAWWDHFLPRFGESESGIAYIDKMYMVSIDIYPAYYILEDLPNGIIKNRKNIFNIYFCYIQWYLSALGSKQMASLPRLVCIDIDGATQ